MTSLHGDEIADLLWPESEGDKVARNHYAATDDLRRLLAEVPGVRVMSNEQRYALVLSENARSPNVGRADVSSAGRGSG